MGTLTPDDTTVNESGSVTPDGAPAHQMDMDTTGSMVKDDAPGTGRNDSRVNGASAGTNEGVRKSTRCKQQPRRLIFERLGECSEL